LEAHIPVAATNELVSVANWASNLTGLMRQGLRGDYFLTGLIQIVIK
jgi:hypothetical protein